MVDGVVGEEVETCFLCACGLASELSGAGGEEDEEEEEDGVREGGHAGWGMMVHWFGMWLCFDESLFL